MSRQTEHVDILVVGAGLSGVGAAWHLRHHSAGTRFAVLEEKETFGGTWVTHRYPGIRSDSDLYTFGYRFKPWVGAPIATAVEILKYMGQVIAENDLGRHIRYRHRIERAQWRSDTRRWHLQVRDLATGNTVEMTCSFLWMCQGYYRHDQGYTPQWPGMARYRGRIVHPQTWPDDLRHHGQRVLVIGSGATAATLIPAMAGECAHITMLQRSPTYFRTARNANDLADVLRSLEVPDAWTHEIVRRKILKDNSDFARAAHRDPEAMKTLLLDGVRAALGDDQAVQDHFTPRYRPWQQRVAFVPDADLFKAIKSGRASVVTDEIETFTEEGVELRSGRELKADTIITATGFHLSAFGGIPFEIDGRPLDLHDTVTWRGAMFTGVPNLLWVFGYLRASWTLRVDLLGDFVCRLLDHMKARGSTVVVPKLRMQDQTMACKPWIEEDTFNPGYLARGMHLMPKQGSHDPWRHTQDYEEERVTLPAADLADGSLHFA